MSTDVAPGIGTDLHAPAFIAAERRALSVWEPEQRRTRQPRDNKYGSQRRLPSQCRGSERWKR